MKKITLLFIALVGLLFLPFASLSVRSEEVRFVDGSLIIAQFTDLHWDARSRKKQKTEAILRSVVNQEQPHLIVLTGDIVTTSPAEKGWLELLAILNDLKTPFMVTLGNHDTEVLAGDKIFSLLASNSPYFIGTNYERDIDGYGNMVLPIKGAKGDATALLYFFDSHSSEPNPLLGTYQKIQWNQIEWYRNRSREFSASSPNETPIPALAFFHIPLQEYALLKGDTKTYGNWQEGISSAGINSGLFSSFIDMGDVMGMFVGHDHVNDFIGIHMGIAMAFGRNSGADAYDNFVRGGRIIKLYEGERKFDTWITTPEGREPAYYYPSGLNAHAESEMAYSASKDLAQVLPGVSYTYYEGAFKSVEEFKEDHEVSHGVCSNFDISLAPKQDHFGYQFNTFIYIPERGVYRFYTYSDDGSVLYVDDQLVVDNDGGHSARRREGMIALEQGYHHLRLLYFEDYMGEILEVGIVGRNLPERPLQEEDLFIQSGSK